MVYELDDLPDNDDPDTIAKAEAEAEAHRMAVDKPEISLQEKLDSPPPPASPPPTTGPRWWQTLKAVAVIATIVTAGLVFWDRYSSCNPSPPRYQIKQFDVYMIVPEISDKHRAVRAQLGALIVVKNLDDKQTVRVEDLSYQGEINIEGVGSLSKLWIGPRSHLVGEFSAAPGKLAVVPIELDSEILFSGKGEGITLGFPGTWTAKINGRKVRVDIAESFRGMVSRKNWNKLVKTPKALLGPKFYRRRGNR
ncbi:hypothetical protein ACFL51_00290 [Myxococcota bacterium]